MIFLTTGTQIPFDRLVRAMDAWVAARPAPAPEVFGQVLLGKTGSHAPRNFDWAERLDPERYAALFARADVVVAHAGMGTILTALTGGKPLVVMPRRAALGEHRNDHQIATANRLRGRAGLHVADDETALPGCLDRALAEARRPDRPVIPPVADPGFTDALRAFLTGRG